MNEIITIPYYSIQIPCYSMETICYSTQSPYYSVQIRCIENIKIYYSMKNLISLLITCPYFLFINNQPIFFHVIPMENFPFISSLPYFSPRGGGGAFKLAAYNSISINIL